MNIERQLLENKIRYGGVMEKNAEWTQEEEQEILTL